MTGAGGVGKTTLADNLGYEVARLEKQVAIFDLDPQGSLNVACRLNKTPAPKATTAWIYSGFFDGNYTLTPVWEQHVKGLEVFQGGSALFKVMPNLAQASGSHLLKEALSEYPLTHDLIIFDCPATLDQIPKSAGCEIEYLPVNCFRANDSDHHLDGDRPHRQRADWY